MKNATKSIPRILRDNICTVFNALNLMIAIALAAVGAWKNILFIFIILIDLFDNPTLAYQIGDGSRQFD